MKDKFKELKRYPVLVLFFLFIFSFMFVDAIWPKREKSELERRPLAQVPAFSWQELTSNRWTANYDKYTKDQVVGRDAWLKLQSRSESLLFRKKEIGGALLGDNDQLFTKLFALKPNEERQLKANIRILKNFMERHEGDVTLMLAPSASLIYSDWVPAHAPMVNEAAYLDNIFSQLGESNIIDLRAPFTAAKANKLYYSTDHHWTTEGGAYIAYQEFCKRMGLDPMPVVMEDFTVVPGFFGTTYSKCVKWNQKPDSLYYLNLDSKMTVWNVNGLGELSPAPNLENVGLYDMDKLETSDKYAMFLHGNNGYSTIQGKGTGKLLVIKDSYANSFVPYLTANYEQIGVIDPRGYGLPIDDLMEREGYEQVLLLFNFQSFVANGDLAFLYA